MGFFELVKANNLGIKAYRLHVLGNQKLTKGNTEEALKLHAQALQIYDEAYAMGCRKSQNMLSYAILLLRAGRLQQARDLMLEMNKDSSLTKEQKYELRVDYGICQWRLGNFDTSIETLRRAEKNGKTALVYTTLGMVLVDKARQTGDFEEAIAYNNEAMEYDDEDASTLDNMGQLYLALRDKALAEGKTDEAAEHRAKAVAYLKKSHARKATQVTTLYALAQLAYEDGDAEHAREYVLGAEKNLLSAMCPITMDQIQALKEKIG